MTTDTPWQEEVKQQVVSFPTLFAADSLDTSSMLVANHYFATLGNGCYWTENASGKRIITSDWATLRDVTAEQLTASVWCDCIGISEYKSGSSEGHIFLSPKGDIVKPEQYAFLHEHDTRKVTLDTMNPYPQFNIRGCALHRAMPNELMQIETSYLQAALTLFEHWQDHFAQPKQRIVPMTTAHALLARWEKCEEVHVRAEWGVPMWNGKNYVTCAQHIHDRKRASMVIYLEEVIANIKLVCHV